MNRPFLRAMGALNTAVYRVSKGRIFGRVGKAPILLLTVTGRKTGKKRTSPLLYGPAGDGYVVIASVGGAPKHPAWYLNLQGAEAEVQVGGKHVRVRARDAEGEERERLWRQMVDVYASYAEYEKKTTRRIPVVVLEPV